jgi:hypothetical protein
MKIVLCNSFNSFWFSAATVKKLYATGALKGGEWYGNISRSNPVLIKIAESGNQEDLGDVRVEEIPAGANYDIVTVADGREEVVIF